MNIFPQPLSNWQWTQSKAETKGNVISFASVQSQSTVYTKLKFWPDNGTPWKVRGSPPTWLCYIGGVWNNALSQLSRCWKLNLKPNLENWPFVGARLKDYWEDHKSFKDSWPRHHGLESGLQSPVNWLPNALSGWIKYQFVYTAQVIIVLCIYSSMREVLYYSPIMFLVHIFHIFQQSSLRSFRFHPCFLAFFSHSCKWKECSKVPHLLPIHAFSYKLLSNFMQSLQNHISFLFKPSFHFPFTFKLFKIFNFVWSIVLA